MRFFRQGRLSLAEQLEVERLLDEAYAPYEACRAPLSAARVRAAVRWEVDRPAPPPRWSLVSLAGRLSETSLAAGLAALLLAGSFAGLESAAAPEPAAAAGALARVDVPQTDARYLRWVRIGRYAPLNDALDPLLGLSRFQSRDDGAPPTIVFGSSTPQ
ncbi:MAG: hypothetical protein ACRDF0_05105 [Candidatus Limnocylindria bacterium]